MLPSLDFRCARCGYLKPPIAFPSRETPKGWVRNGRVCTSCRNDIGRQHRRKAKGTVPLRLHLHFWSCADCGEKPPIVFPYGFMPRDAKQVPYAPNAYAWLLCWKCEIHARRLVEVDDERE